MSGNGEPIDLNYHVGLGEREVEAHGVVLKDPSNELSKAESFLGDFRASGVKGVMDTNSSRIGLCLLDKDEADQNLGDEAGNGEFLEGKYLGTVEGVGKGIGVQDESFVTTNDSSEAEMGCSEKIHISEKCGDEVVGDDYEIVSDGGNGAGMVNALPSDDLLCREAERQLAGSFTTNEHQAVGIECDVKSQEGVCTIRNEAVVAQDGELSIGSVKVKCDQPMKVRVSHESLEHGNSINVIIDVNPVGPCQHKDFHNSGSLHGDLGFGSAEDTEQLSGNLVQKTEKMMVSEELSPVIATDIRTTPALDFLDNQTRKDGGGQTDENQAACCHFLETGALTDIDEARLFDVVVEMEPHDFSDDVNANPAGSVKEFDVSDLVWGKVQSHPWWPGQICDPSASSKKAMKYFKEDRYLIAFYGDYSFSWKEASTIKPFQEYFGELQKQSNLETFHRAIDYALEEFSRRVEFGLACPCLSDELYSKLQTQTLANAGIRKKSSRRFGGDRHLTASTFDPMSLINTVKEVASLPCVEAGRLDIIRARAQLLAFNRWKGYYELPEFNLHSVVLNYTHDHLGYENEYPGESVKEIPIDVKVDEVVQYGKGNLKTQNSSSGKRKHNSGDRVYSRKKGKKLPGLMSKKPCHILNDKHEYEDEVVDDICNNSAVKHSIVNVPTESAHESKQTNKTFRVGDRIRRVACKLNESSPIFKHDDGTSQTIALDKGNEDPTIMPKKELLLTEYPLIEALSELSLAAINPMEGFGFLNAVVDIFSEFRNFVCIVEQETSELLSGGLTGNKLAKTGKRKEVLASSETSESEFIEDSYWTDRLIQGVADDQSSLQNQDETVECPIQTPSQNIISPVEQDGLVSPGMNSTDQQPCERTELGSEKCMEDVYPTALILNFTDFGSVPSETNLNNIFRKYGDLYESKTEVVKKSRRAKVVFKKSSDAETAFSSAGKFSVFGPSLVSYRLKYLPANKVSPRPVKRRRKGMTSREENTT